MPNSRYGSRKEIDRVTVIFSTAEFIGFRKNNSTNISQYRPNKPLVQWGTIEVFFETMNEVG